MDLKRIKFVSSFAELSKAYTAFLAVYLAFLLAMGFLYYYLQNYTIQRLISPGFCQSGKTNHIITSTWHSVVILQTYITS